MSSPALVLTTESVQEVKVHPVVVFQVLDRSLRRADEQGRVIGTLLGHMDNGIVHVTNSFAVPHLENGDEVAVGKDFHTHMYRLHQRVNDKEMVVGWYATTADTTGHSSSSSSSGSSSSRSVINEHSGLIHDFYGSICDAPVHLVVDTRLERDAVDLAAFVSAPLDVMDAALTNQFKQVPLTQKLTEPETIALHAMASGHVESTSTSSSTSAHGTTTTLPDELAALQDAMERLYKCIDSAAQYTSDVVAGAAPCDGKVGRELADALSAIPLMRQEQFDQVFSTGVQDLLMVSYLSGLTQAQLSMAEKLINT